MGAGGGQSPARTGQHDPRRALHPRHIVATIIIGIPLNRLLGGTRTALQRIAIALVSIPSTVVLAVVLFSFNALLPDAYAGFLRFADWVWQVSLNG